MNRAVLKLRLRTLALSLLLAAAAGPAFALGLGQIQVKSRMNEPLVADIPVITGDPSELAQLQARLAAPETFVRIGLPLPDRLVSDLHFQVIDGADGKPYIRVTSTTPVNQPLVNFLVEVDWGEGKLVREYSALVATPDSVAATAPPVVEAPSVATSPVNVIERPAPGATIPATVAPTAPVRADGKKPAPPATAPKAAAPVASVAGKPAPPPVVPRPVAAPTAIPPTAASPAAAASGAKYGPVQRGQTLGGIVGSLQDGGQDRDAVMQALVALNPEAFIGGDPNRIRQGAVLRMPEGVQPPGAADQAGKAIARNVARAEIARSRSNRSAPRRPVDVANAPANAARARAATDASAPATRVADARLRIMPAAGGDAGAAGTKTGRGSSGGNGDMLQQLQQAQETVATRDAEINELKSRVGELEQIQHKQAQLIAMKNSELASAQQKLAARQAAPANAAGGIGLWWLLPAALAAALLAALWRLFGRRRGREVTRGFASATQAPVPVETTPPAAPADAAAGSDETPAQAREDGLPAWARGDAWLPETGAPAEADPATAPAAGAAPAMAVSDSRLRLARTYIDLGDIATARALLQDVRQEGDAAARAEAMALLDSLR